MTPQRTTLDVSELPTVVVGKSSISWFATLAFMLIEGTALVVCIASYFYLRQNFPAWPPPTTPLPDLAVPTLNTLLLLLAMLPMAAVARGARRLDRRAVTLGFAVTVLLTLVIGLLRIWEFAALNTRWDQHAYGSIVWVTLGFHTTLLLIDLVETACMTWLMHSGPVEHKHFGDALDAAHYQYFLSLSYVPIYLLLFLSPRWL